MKYVALYEIIGFMVVWCTQKAPRRQQFHVAPAIYQANRKEHHLSGYSKHAIKSVTHLESHATKAQ